jgi:tRNA A37 methylthiotransferase MiaB
VLIPAEFEVFQEKDGNVHELSIAPRQETGGIRRFVQVLPRQLSSRAFPGIAKQIRIRYGCRVHQTAMKPRILLINPWIHDFAAFNLWARPLGLLSVAEYLSGFDAELRFIDCLHSFEQGRYGIGKYRSEHILKPALLKSVPRYYKRYGISVAQFRAALSQAAPVDVVLMTSVMSYWYPGVQETIKRVRETMPDTPVILGGIYPTLYREHAMMHSGADRVFEGRVDDRLSDMIHEFGISLQRAHKPAANEMHGFLPDHSYGVLLTSKGCPFHCSYCASNLLSPEFEQRETGEIIPIIRCFYDRGVRDFAFYDDALLYDADKHIKPLLASIIANGFAVRLHAPNGLHARFIDEDVAVLMKRAGFRTIRLSLETIDRDRQRKSGGKVTNSDFARAVKLLKRAGFSKDQLGAYLLYGLPGQPLDEVEDAVGFVKSLGVRVHLAEFSPIRGTTSWDELVRKNTIASDLDPLLTNNTVYSFLYSGYDPKEVERIRLDVKDHNDS